MANGTKSAIPEPTRIVDLGELTVDTRVTIAEHVAAMERPDYVAHISRWATDENFPETNTGIIVYAASAWLFDISIPHDLLLARAQLNGKILGGVKSLFILRPEHQRPNLSVALPLVAAGQLFKEAEAIQAAPSLWSGTVERYLSSTMLSPGGVWHNDLLFLVLEQLRRSGD